MSCIILLLLIGTILNLQPSAESLPLSMNSRWIVDENGQRVKLACVSWVSHLETVLVEGMNKQPLDIISQKIASLGFNCVRLTWPLFLATNDSLANTTVRQSFQALGLVESLAAIQVNNPALLDLTLIQAFQAVVNSLAENKIMVILDNHISKPGWCCSNYDGNGFFGDEYFNPEVWINALAKMATMFNGYSYVVAMSLRNELRGPRQNVNDWYRYMQKGAEAVHAANPDVLVILSGLTFDTDLSFLSAKKVELSFTGKLVFELHWYAFSNGQEWVNGNANQVCGRIVSNVRRKATFLLDRSFPLFLSEFGFDQRGTNVNDNRFLSCMMGAAAELDLDWAIWALQGNYYIREGVVASEEFYGLLAYDWCRTRNITMLQRVQALQAPFQGPGLSDVTPYTVLFHPLTGQCILRKSLLEPPVLGPCEQSEAWSFTEQRTLAITDALLCLKADGNGKPAKFSFVCNDDRSRWEQVSDSKMHLSSRMSSSNITLCLDVDSESKMIVTNPCKCLSRDHTCDPMSQWFKTVNTTRPIATQNSVLKLFFRAETWRSVGNQLLSMLLF